MSVLNTIGLYIFNGWDSKLYVICILLQFLKWKKKANWIDFHVRIVPKIFKKEREIEAPKRQINTIRYEKIVMEKTTEG